MSMLFRCFFGFTLAVCLAPVAWAQISLPEANGQDGAFEPNSNIEVDLSLAVTADPGQWVSTSSSSEGVYDADEWAVIFRYSSVTIPNNVTVTFKNHPSGAPVIWLVNGDVTIEGTVSLNGASGHGDGSTPALSEPGPGGFHGGRGATSSSPASSGLGPGGGKLREDSSVNQSSGSYATVGNSPQGPDFEGAVYGNAAIIPLIGGSGGSGSNSASWGGGGAGGGAILIAATDGILLNGLIRALGGNRPHSQGGGSGSGGAIRLVADDVSGSGMLRAIGGNNGTGGNGRIRVESNSLELADLGEPPFSYFQLTDPPEITRSASLPAIRPTTLGGQPVPVEPTNRLNPPPDVQLSEAGTATLLLEGRNIAAEWLVSVQVVPMVGQPVDYTADFVSSDGDTSQWSVEIDLSQGFSTIQARADAP